jgi:integrase
MDGADIKTHIIVKISKSESTKVKKDGAKIKTKARYRKMIFPQWISEEDFIFLRDHHDTKKLRKSQSMMKRTLDYLRKYHNCNTHSLRYAMINYLLNEKKIGMYIVAKFVGHVNTNMLVRYTQNKNVDKLLNEEI